ncbi:hypothetical protein ACKKBG_A28990 [Auxenochlorella protothecoides x Auxenochlorella symbiontica]
MRIRLKQLPGLLLALGVALAAWPTDAQSTLIRLKTGQIAAHGPSSRDQVHRLLLTNSEPQSLSPHWGPLSQKQQWLVTPQQGESLTSAAGAVEAAGGVILGHVPDNTLLVMGPPGLEQALRARSRIFLLPYEPQHKLSPEWAPILRTLEAAAQASLAQQQSVLSSLPMATSGTGPALRLLITAIFPPRPAGGAGAAAPDPGRAAVADWAAPLRTAFGGGVDVVRGGSGAAVVLCPPFLLQDVLTWLAAQPMVHWISPLPRMQLQNNQASAITQAGTGALSTSQNSFDNPEVHPIWAAGITGTGQVIGGGDSGVDRFHCFFYDPSVDWDAQVTTQGGVQVFESETHRKIRYYRAFGDFADANGHGTHVMGTLLGSTTGASVSRSTDAAYIGMAPDAKLAFIDLAEGSQSIYTPADIQNQYFAYTTAVGAMLHSDSWGVSAISYDYLASQIDWYHWDNPDFLAMFAAGNDGESTTAGNPIGEMTVTSPATAKNLIAVGATQTTGQSLGSVGSQYVVYEATVKRGDLNLLAFKVLQGSFGDGLSTLGTTSYPLVAADPLLACEAMVNATAVAGAIVLVERGTCALASKVQNAQTAGAAAALIFDNVLGGYFVSAANGSLANSVTLPNMSITRRLGQTLLASFSSGLALTITLSPASAPANAFENLASYSSQGPTPDGRVKPDLVAPGSLFSAKSSTSGTETCELQGLVGTSMATPVVAGSAALVRQYFMDGWYPFGVKNASAGFTPSGALTKATLISGAASMTGFEALTGLPIDPPPSFRQGFGRVLLDTTLPLPNSERNFTLQVVDRVEVATGDTHRYCVRSTGGPLTVTLVWTDYPALPSVSKVLVNDLDLTVRASGLGGIPLLGNGGSIANETQPDRENNVEQVSMSFLPVGPVAIQVDAHFVHASAGRQPYALAVNGAFAGTLVVPGDGEQGPACTIVVPSITKGPSGPTNASPIVFEFAAAGNAAYGGLAWECLLADGNGAVGSTGTQDWKACSSPASFAGLPDGTYEFSVRAQGETTQANQTFVLDTSPPVLAFNGGTPASGSTSDAPMVNVSFAGQDPLPVNYTCALAVEDAAVMQGPVFAGAIAPAIWPLQSRAACESPAIFHWLLPGTWSLSVVAEDAAGNQASPAVYSWTVAFSAGQQYARLTSGPFGLSRLLESASFEFGVFAVQSSGASLTQVAQPSTRCWLAGPGTSGSSPSWAPCTSPHIYANLSEGAYTFYVQPTEAATLSLMGAGAVPMGGVTALSAFALDGTPPVATLTASPAAILASNSTVANFTSNEAGSTFTCTLTAPDGSSRTSNCTSPYVMTGLEDGKFELAVTPTDVVGNVGSQVRTSFLVDTTPPTLSDVSFPVATRQTQFAVSFTASDGNGSGIAYAQCRLQAATLVSGSATQMDTAWKNCTSPQTYTGLEEGHWLLNIQAIDKAGNVATLGDQDVWIDQTPPTVSVTSGPASFASVEGALSFSFSETAGAGALAPIATFQLRLAPISRDLFDSLRNGSASEGTSSTLGTLLGGAGRRLLEDDVGTVQAGDALASWTNCSASCSVEGLASGTYTHSARGIDLAGNVGNATAAVPFTYTQPPGPGFPVWAIAVAAGGGALLLIILALLVCMCWRRRNSRKAAATPAGASLGAHPHPPAGYATQPAWPGPHPSGQAYQYPPQGQTYIYSSGRMHDERAREEQELALALAASKQEAELAAQRAQQAPAWGRPVGALPDPAPPIAPRRAYPATAPHPQDEEDAQLRAAIAESLRLQQQTQQWNPWRG